jgi:hypothetical protein
MLKEVELKDTEFITRLVMERLQIEPMNGSAQNLSLEKSEVLKQTIESIALIEDDWEYKSADETHFYGRKYEG